MTPPDDPVYTPEEREALREALLGWYAHHKRDLPWRGEEVSAYGTWVSEIMLQQTQVATVRDYWIRWMEVFPDVEALAAAELEQVLEMWSGLGYYRRARLLHEGAKYVVEELGGELPETAKELRALPGVGPYTAGAIASIAFGEAAPLVDGNVERVFARWRAIGGDPKGKANQATFWAIAGELVDTGDPSSFNQALMELGATVCTPKNPSCLLCPVRASCAALEAGEVTAYPGKRARKAPREVALQTCVVATEAGEVLLVKRPDEGIWAGLLEPPTAPAGEVEALLGELLGEHAAPPGAPIGQLEHRLSHRLMRFEVRALTLPGPVALGGDRARWVPAAEVEGAALSSAARKLLALARGAHTP
jgi:A/G-specific adenine glycosylase